MITDKFKCPHCDQEIELSEAFTHQIREDFEKESSAKNQKRIEEEVARAKQKLAEENKLNLQKQAEETKDLKDLLNTLKEQLLQSNRESRELKIKQEQAEIEKEKAIAQAQEKARSEALKNSDEVHRLKEKENEKVISDLKKALDDAKRKAEQGSMQTQGEVLELDLEDSLRLAFPHDEVMPVEKGVSGADVRQVVKSPRGTTCGTILWEFKRTKTWSNEWVSKLKNDVRNERANIGALISQAFPPNVKGNIELVNGVWVTNSLNILPLAILLRKNILDIAREKFISQNSTEKSQQLYSYITGHEFRQQLEALAEIFGGMNTQIIKERVAFEKSWKQREGQINRLFISTANILGGIEGTGVNIPQIKGFELLELEEGKEEIQPKLLDEDAN